MLSLRQLYQHPAVHATQNPFQSIQQILELQNEQHSREWAACWENILAEGRQGPEDHRKYREKLDDFSPYVNKVTAGGVDETIWAQMIIPTITVHLKAVDRRTKDTSYESSAAAMHHALIMIPVATTILPGAWDINDLIFLLGDRITSDYMDSTRGKELAKMGGLEAQRSHHKRFEYEHGGIRFVIAACGSDRPAQVLHFTPNEPNRKPFEMMHMYNASGMRREHHLQQMILVRIRDFALAKVVISVVQSIMEGGARIALRGVHKEEKENVRNVIECFSRYMCTHE